MNDRQQNYYYLHWFKKNTDLWHGFLFTEKIKTKFEGICDKTGREPVRDGTKTEPIFVLFYDVPFKVLFQSCPKFLTA